MGSGNNDFLVLDFAMGLGLGSTWHNKCSSILPGTTVVPGIPQFKEKNKENETFQKQSAMLEEVVKLLLALVWHPPLRATSYLGPD